MTLTRPLGRLLRCACAIGLMLLVSGCVVVPVYPWHPHYGYWR